jgi:acyl-CoA thioester hydrolase
MAHFCIRRKVEFSDTDMAGMVHFSRFFAFMESCELEYLSSVGFSLATPILGPGGRRIGWPRVAARCEYIAAVRFSEELEVDLIEVRKGTTSLTFLFDIRSQGEPVARGEITTVCCETGERGALHPIPIPLALSAAIEALRTSRSEL